MRDIPDNVSPIQSEFADDPEMRELVEFFIGDLHARFCAIQTAREHCEWGAVERIAHQLRGSAAGYGFTCLGVLAGEIEDTIKSGEYRSASRLRESLDELMLMCERIFASAGRRAA